MSRRAFAETWRSGTQFTGLLVPPRRPPAPDPLKFMGKTHRRVLLLLGTWATLLVLFLIVVQTPTMRPGSRGVLVDQPFLGMSSVATDLLSGTRFGRGGVLTALIVSGLILGTLVTRILRYDHWFLPMPAVCLAMVAMACWLTSPFSDLLLQYAGVCTLSLVLGTASILAAGWMAQNPREEPIRDWILVLLTVAGVLASMALWVHPTNPTYTLAVIGAALLLGRPGIAVALVVFPFAFILGLEGFIDAFWPRYETQSSSIYQRDWGFRFSGVHGLWFLVTHSPLVGAAVAAWPVWSRRPTSRILAVTLALALPTLLVSQSGMHPGLVYLGLVWPLCGLAVLGAFQSGPRSVVCMGLLAVQLTLGTALCLRDWPWK